MFAEISSEGLTLGIVTAVIALLGTVFTGIMAYLMARLNQKAGDATDQVKEVKETLVGQDTKIADKLEGLKTVAASTHTLVNNAMAIQLRLNAVVSRRLADMTRTRPDQDAADVAEQAYQEHMLRQKKVDAEESKK